MSASRAGVVAHEVVGDRPRHLLGVVVDVQLGGVALARAAERPEHQVAGAGIDGEVREPPLTVERHDLPRTGIELHQRDEWSFSA